MRNDRRGAWKILTSLLSVEVLLHLRQQVSGNAGGAIGHEVLSMARQPLVSHHNLGGGSCDGVDGETLSDELLGSLGDILPILNRLKLVVTSDDSLRLLGLRVPVERCITAEEEIGDNAHGPDVDGFVVAS